MTDIIVLSGPVGVGKTAFRDVLLLLMRARKLSTSDFIVRKTGADRERGALQIAGEQLDRETGGSWVADAVTADFEANGDGVLLVDSAKIRGQVEALRERFSKVFHVHPHACDDVLESRYLTRDPDHREFATYAEVRRSLTEASVGELALIADLVLDTDHANPRTLAEVAVAFRGKRRVVPPPVVDLVVGSTGRCSAVPWR